MQFFLHLIDGEKTIFKLVIEFCDIPPTEDIQSLFFKVKNMGKVAGLSNNFSFIRFLGLVLEGKKFFTDNEEAIMKNSLTGQESCEEDSDEQNPEQECYQTTSTGRKASKMPIYQKIKDKNGYECGKYGHFAANCYQKKCSNCAGNGYDYTQCHSKRRTKKKL